MMERIIKVIIAGLDNAGKTSILTAGNIPINLNEKNKNPYFVFTEI